MKSEYRGWTIYWGAYGDKHFWSDVMKNELEPPPPIRVGTDFQTRMAAIGAAKALINEKLWHYYCEGNKAHEMECANTREAFAEWCADRDVDGWSNY